MLSYSLQAMHSKEDCGLMQPNVVDIWTIDWCFSTIYPSVFTVCFTLAITLANMILVFQQFILYNFLTNTFMYQL